MGLHFRPDHCALTHSRLWKAVVTSSSSNFVISCFNSSIIAAFPLSSKSQNQTISLIHIYEIIPSQSVHLQTHLPLTPPQPPVLQQLTAVPPKLPSKHDAAVKLLPSEANSTRKNPATDLKHDLDKLHHTTELQHVSQAPKIERPQKTVSDAVLTKLHQIAQSREPKTLLCAAGHKTELLDRLIEVDDNDDYFSIDQDNDRPPPRDMNPQCLPPAPHHPL